MGILPAKNSLEHIAIEYEVGAVTLRFREYCQTIRLFKKVERYGENNFVLSRSGLFEREHAVVRGDLRFFCVLCTGVLMPNGTPRGANEYGDECVVVKISNTEGED